MAYLFRIKSQTFGRYIWAQPSTLGNKYITHTSQVTTTTGFSPAGDWVTFENPTLLIGGGASASLKIFNPFTGSFLGNTEQGVAISGAPTAYGTVSGLLNFTTSDTACSFIFKAIAGSAYQILLDDPLVPNKADLKYKAIIDINSTNLGTNTKSPRIIFVDKNTPAASGTSDAFVLDNVLGL
ncbi:hypothetical protein [Ochrobactrum sp. SFR4]|uniref:hypothetical protein n=1 Tax=Ochrobactrum sp. SFR4 TaxID=2717368 RepID=UPI001C8CF1DD|nr:hypothetical protein [Ochrobactrum sp. SFR4]MBX8826162.1 hypothetical protein [Ochrobactrum sp. SFR4]